MFIFDPAELGLLDYPSIVKKPMDFSTIKVSLFNLKILERIGKGQVYNL